MLTVFVAMQIGVNMALLLALFLLLRERNVTARLAAAREERLEALAAEFCALGQAVAAGATTSSRPRPHGEPDRPDCPERNDTRTAEASVPPLAPPETPEHLQAAAALLDRGLPVAAVAAKTAILDGEVQVLRNLRRSRTSAGRRSTSARKQPSPATA